MSGSPPISLMPPSARSSLSRSRVSFEQLALRQPALLGVDALLELAQPLDRLRNRLEIGQHAAEPAVVDVILAAALGRLGDRLLRLPLGADEQHAAAAGDDLADRLQPLPQQRHALFEVDDVDAVADAEDVRRHLRVPAPRVMAEMHAGFEKLAHRILGQCHALSFPVVPPQEKIGPDRSGPTPERCAAIPARRKPCVRGFRAD